MPASKPTALASSKLEPTTPVRPGQELPLGALTAYLRAHAPQLSGEVQVAQFPSGYSNLTYLVQIGETELVLRRPPPGAEIASAHDMGREVRVLRGLGRVYDRAPQPLLDCTDPSIIGAPFYLMPRLPGVVLRAAPGQLPTLPPHVMAGLATAAVDNLATIHALDYAAAGLGDLGRPAGYVARQIQGWTKRYTAAATDPQPDLEAALAWLADHQPPDPSQDQNRVAIIHNDYKYDNLLLDSDDLTRIIAVLDWEMCTLGDPLLDLGTTLGYWIEPGDPPPLVDMFGLTTLPGNLDREGVVARYLAASGCPTFDPLFYYVYGIAKIGVILQQIYARYRHGASHDPRFATLGAAVAACGHMAAQAIASRRMTRLNT